MRIPLLWALMAATAAGDDLSALAEPRRPEPEPLPPADPDQVGRLATEGTEARIWAYLRTHRTNRTQHADLLRRIDELRQARRQAADEAAREKKALELAAHEAARLAEWQANPLSVRCPRCHARPGKRCRGAKAFMNTPHPERVRAAQRKAAR